MPRPILPKKSTMFRNMAVSYTIIVLISVMATTLVLTVSFQNREIRRINSHLLSTLVQASHTASLMMEQANAIGNQALNDWALVNAMNQASYSPLTEYRALLKLRQYKNSNVLFDHLGIYSDRTGRYLSDGILNPLFPGRYLALLDQPGQPNVLTLPESIEIVSTTGNSYRNVITLIYRNQYRTAADRSCFTVSFDQQALVTLTRSDSIEGGDQVFVLDESGRVVSHPDSSLFMSSLADQAFVARILASGEQSGNFVDLAFGASSLISFARSPATGWIFVSTYPYSLLSGNLFQLNGVVLLISLAVIVVAVALTLQQSYRIYGPLSNLVNRVGGYTPEGGAAAEGSDITYLGRVFDQVMDRTQQLQQALSSAQPVLADSLYMLLLSGRINDIPDGASQMLEELQQWQGRYFTVALIQLDMEGLSVQDAARQWEAFAPLLEEAAGRLTPEFTRYKALYLEDYTAALLIQFDQEQPGPKLEALCVELKQTLKVALRMSVGLPVKGLEALHLAYRQAQLTLRYSYLRGVGRLLSYREISGQLSHQAHYPVELEKGICEQLRNRRVAEFYETLHQFAEYLSALTAGQAIQYMDQLRLSLYKAFYEFLSLRDQTLLAYPARSGFRELARDELDLRLIGVQLMNAMEEQQTNRNQPIVDRVTALVAQHYADPDLSVDSLARQVGLSANYLSRIFKAISGESLHSYLMNARMERAMQLLEASAEPVGRISELVGIQNVNYFYTLFKKRYGITPTEYRRQRAGD